MSRKRKAQGQPNGEPMGKNLKNDSKLVVNSYRDVLEPQEEFDLARDKILVDETPAQTQRRILREQEEFFEPSDEEVFAHSSSESEDNEDDGGEEEDSDSRLHVRSDNRGTQNFKRTRYREESDVSKQSEDEGEGGWGAAKSEYYDADHIETEADALEEEAEALRLQKKQLQKMTDADFGLDDDNVWLDAKDNDTRDPLGSRGVVREVLPQLEIADEAGPEERTKILYARYPEFKYLAQEYIALQALHEDLKANMVEAISLQHHLVGPTRGFSEIAPQPAVASVVILKSNSLSAYLGAICMYFSLFTAPRQEENNSKSKAVNPNELHDHSIMEFLLSCRETWEIVKNIRDPDPTDMMPMQTFLQEVEFTPDSTLKIGASSITKPNAKRSRKSRTQKAYEAAVAQAKADRFARVQRAEEDLKNFYSKPSMSHGKAADQTAPLAGDSDMEAGNDSDFGEELHLNEYDAEEKAKRKKGLQFYTAQIAQKANRRGAASRAAGGDDDIPYKERLRDRQERLNKEAERRGKEGRDTTALAIGLGDSSGEEDRGGTQSEQPRNSDDDRYDQMTARPAALKAARKAKRTAEYQAKLAAEAEANGDRVVAVEQVGPDGKRAIGYTIEKNKGLAPHRKKDVRNPRVKKRKKFDEKKKKQRNMRPVYKGGEGRGGYGGELTGIKKGIVKSIKL